MTVSNTLLCPAIDCVQQNMVSTLAFNIHLFNFPLSTCFGCIMRRSAWIIKEKKLHFKHKYAIFIQ